MPSTNKALCGKAQQQQHAIAGHEWQGNHNFYFFGYWSVFENCDLLCILTGEKQLTDHTSCCGRGLWWSVLGVGKPYFQSI